MRKFLLVSLLALGAAKGLAQETSVEKSVFNAQIGFFGIYVNNESRLGDNFALRTEIGLDGAFSTGKYVETRWALAPSLNIEPRYYYNLTKRVNKNRRIKNNSANFVTVSFKYMPDWFVIGSDNFKVPNQLYIIPKWGIRRNIGNSNFNYEAGAGLGYYTILDSNRKYYSEPEGVAIDLHLRIGYRF